MFLMQMEKIGSIVPKKPLQKPENLTSSTMEEFLKAALKGDSSSIRIINAYLQDALLKSKQFDMLFFGGTVFINEKTTRQSFVEPAIDPRWLFNKIEKSDDGQYVARSAFGSVFFKLNDNGTLTVTGPKDMDKDTVNLLNDMMREFWAKKK